MRALIVKSCRQQIFIKKLKNKIFHFFFKIIQYPFNGSFQINFYVRVPLNNTKNHFHKKTNPNNRFLYFCHKIVLFPFNAFCQFNPWGRSSLNHADNRFSSKNWKIKFFIFFSKSYNIPWMEFFRLFFTCAYPEIIPKTIFIRKKSRKTDFFNFCHKMVLYPFNALCQLNSWGRSSLNHADNRFSSKNWKIKFFIFFSKSYNIPLMEVFRLTFACAYP